MKGSRIWMVLAALVALVGSRAFGAGGVFVVDGVPQRHAGLASQAYVDAHVPALSVAASNATRLIQIDTQAWVTVAGGTATLWQVVFTQDVLLVASTLESANDPGHLLTYRGDGYWWDGQSFYGGTRAERNPGTTNWLFTIPNFGMTWVGGSFPMLPADVIRDGNNHLTLQQVGTNLTAYAPDAPYPITNAYPLARVEDLGAYCTAAQLAAASNALAQAMVEFAATNDPCTFPVLVLPLGGQWTDFELKASTNNFTTLCYYIMSSGTNAYTSDTNVWVYFTDDYAADVRQWRRSAVATSIGSQVVNPSKSEVEFVVVLPSHACAVDWRQWMSQKNDKLVWSFVRYDGIGLEMNATGTKTHWSPVVPVEWRRERIAP